MELESVSEKWFHPIYINFFLKRTPLHPVYIF